LKKSNRQPAEKYDLPEVKRELRKCGSKEKARLLQGFFKTGKGEYAEGDIFIGVNVPDTRSISRKCVGLSKSEVLELLRSRIHEERLLALLVLIERFKEAGRIEKEEIFRLYLENSRHINNWDLVDLSAPRIAGAFLNDKDKRLLYDLAGSRVIWERRIAIISTLYFIKQGKFRETLNISSMLLADKEDLIHKAVGWMLREVGKLDLEAEERFLKKYAASMPRTMLRYAIERFPESKRRHYLSIPRERG
jgi:3-methyladenine DNA glycosylase AlkD